MSEDRSDSDGPGFGDRVRFGVLGAAKISGKALLEPALDTPRAEVVAIAARDRVRAEAQAEEYAIARVLDDYEAVVADPEVDAVYNPLPISLHHRWTIAALNAGKHVLCEKPFASNEAEAVEMVAAAEANGRLLIEAFHWRYHPLAARLREVLDSGVLGQLGAIDAGFSVPIDPQDDVRQSWELSGGALMDLGCYPLQWARFAGVGEPRVVAASMIEGRQNVDVVTDIDLVFDDGVTARVHTAMDESASFAAWLEVKGSTGSLRVTNPLAPHVGHEVAIETGDGVTISTVPGRTSYHHQLEGFVAAVLDGAVVPTGGADAIATTRLIDAAYGAAGLPIRGS